MLLLSVEGRLRRREGSLTHTAKRSGSGGNRELPAWGDATKRR